MFSGGYRQVTLGCNGLTEYVRFHKVFEKTKSSEWNTKYSKKEVRITMYFNIPSLK